jgi:hypothetical protein
MYVRVHTEQRADTSPSSEPIMDRGNGERFDRTRVPIDGADVNTCDVLVGMSL